MQGFCSRRRFDSCAPFCTRFFEFFDTVLVGVVRAPIEQSWLEFARRCRRERVKNGPFALASGMAERSMGRADRLLPCGLRGSRHASADRIPGLDRWPEVGS